MIQPNAQVCRRLAGASLECRHSPPSPSSPFLSRRSGGRAGSPPRALAPLSCPPPTPDRSSPRTQLPTGPGGRGTATSPSTTTIANYGTQAQVRAHGRAGNTRSYVCGKRACACVCIAPRRRYVTSSHGNQCSWPPTRSHGAKPTRPASFGHLCAKARARARASYLSLALSLFLDLSPVALPPRPSRAVRFSSCEPFGLSSFSFFSPVLSSRPPLCIFPRCSVKITPCVPASDISIPSEIDTAREGEEGRRREGYISSNVNSLK